MPYNDKERLEREALESLVASDLSAKMKQWRSSNNPPPPPQNRVLRWLLLLLVIAGAIWLFRPWQAEKKAAPAPPAPPVATVPESSPPPPVAEPKQTAPSRKYLAIALQHYNIPDFADEVRSGNANHPTSDLQTARTALAARQYAAALETLKNLPPEYQSDVLYLRGHAFFGQKRYAQAIGAFKQLERSPRYDEAASWYLLLARLADDPAAVAAVKKELQNMAQSEGHTFQQEAAALLRALD
jgi:tetratricopeptide (TPR) repeat protein